jgi:hypothetical protein
MVVRVLPRESATGELTGFLQFRCQLRHLLLHRHELIFSLLAQLMSGREIRRQRGNLSTAASITTMLTRSHSASSAFGACVLEVLFKFLDLFTQACDCLSLKGVGSYGHQQVTTSRLSAEFVKQQRTCSCCISSLPSSVRFREVL